MFCANKTDLAFPCSIYRKELKQERTIRKLRKICLQAAPNRPRLLPVASERDLYLHNGELVIIADRVWQEETTKDSASSLQSAIVIFKCHFGAITTRLPHPGLHSTPGERWNMFQSYDKLHKKWNKTTSECLG